MELSILPAIPPREIRDIAFVFLLPAMIARIGFLVPPLRELRSLFEGETKNFIEAVKTLEIKGLRNYLVQELYMLIGPYILAVVIFLFVLPSVELTELGLNLTLFSVVGLLFWMVMDISHSRENGKFITTIVDEFRSFPFSGNDGKKIVELLALIGEARHNLKVIREVTNSAPEFVKKVGESLPLGGFRATTKLIVGTLVDIFEKTAEYAELAKSAVAGKILEFFDRKIESKFIKFVDRTWSEILIPLVWGLLPMIWLYAILEYNSGFSTVISLKTKLFNILNSSQAYLAIIILTTFFIYVVWRMGRK